MSERRVSRRWKWLLVGLALVAAAAPWPLSHAGTALVVSRDLAAPDAIVMLASHEWERLPAAAALARQHPDALVLLTVPIVVTQYNCHLCPDRPSWLAAEGVDPSRIRIVPQRARNTWEEAQAVKAYAALQPFTRLLVVTSAYHTRRAWGTFERVFAGTPIQVGVVPAMPEQARPARWWTTPYDRHYVLYEWAAG
jgi:uncharacterized SAM-binding protein YcdF (DUF218 family)